MENLMQFCADLYTYIAPYIATILSLSRLFISLGLLIKYRNSKQINYNIVIPLALWCIASDKLDGIVARRIGSIPYGGEIDFYCDRISITVLFYFLSQLGLCGISPRPLFALLVMPEGLMSLWKATQLWPPSQDIAVQMHPFFPLHLGRVSIVVQSIFGVILFGAKSYLGKIGEALCTYSFLFGTILTWIAVIYYPICMWLGYF